MHCVIICTCNFIARSKWKDSAASLVLRISGASRTGEVKTTEAFIPSTIVTTGKFYFTQSRYLYFAESCRVDSRQRASFAEGHVTRSAKGSLPRAECRLSAKRLFAESSTLGKGGLSAKSLSTKRQLPASSLPNARWQGPRQSNLCRVSWLALGKVFFLVLEAQFFFVLCVTIANYILKFRRNLSFFVIFN